MVFTVLGKPIEATISYVFAFSFKSSVSIRVLALSLLSLAFTANARAGQVTLVWDANTDPELGGYKLYYGPNSGNYTGYVDVGNQTTSTLTGLADGQTYYFAVTNYDLLGQNESAFSNEVQATTPAIAATPVAGFSVTPTTGAAALNVAFTDTSSGLITNWNWNFGDGTTSTSKNPSHTYSAPGTYSVGLAVTGPGGSNSITKTNFITVSVTAPVANFTATPTTGTAALNVAFTDTSTGLITNWNWNFGDGTSSTSKNPSHTYSAPGTYSVGLTVTGTGGSNTVTKNNYITVATPAPTWTLTITSSNPASGASITVSPNDNSSQGSGVSQFTRTYNNNVAVTLTAPATAGGNNFKSWSGCDTSSGATCNLNMNANKTVTANFALNTFPDTNITSAPSALTNSMSASFSFTSTEAGSTFECSLDGNAFTSCASPASYSSLAGTIHAFQVRAINQFGNTDATPARFTWTVDIAPPDTNITAGPSGTITVNTATFQFTSTEANSRFECSFDGAAFSSCASGITYNSLANGNHNFQARAIDAVGNLDPTPASQAFTVNVSPGPSLIESPSSVLQGGNVTAAWSGIGNPTPKDWIGLYAAGARNSSYLTWVYVSCSQSATVANASGSCGLGIPGNLANGSYELRFLANDGYSVVATSNAFGVGGPPLPVVSIVATSNAAEPATNGQFTVSRTGSTASAMTVIFTVGGTATQGTDYGNIGTSVVIPAGSATVTIPVNVIDDSVYEGTETVMVTLSTNANYTAGNPNSATVNIVDNEAPPPGPTIGASTTTVDRGGFVNVIWSGIVNPTYTDWIGLYATGAGNTSYLNWIYVSCSTTATTATAAGSCNLFIPAYLAAGTYELRLLANDGFNGIAVSRPLIVQ